MGGILGIELNSCGCGNGNHYIGLGHSVFGHGVVRLECDGLNACDGIVLLELVELDVDALSPRGNVHHLNDVIAGGSVEGSCGIEAVLTFGTGEGGAASTVA